MVTNTRRTSTVTKKCHSIFAATETCNIFWEKYQTIYLIFLPYCKVKMSLIKFTLIFTLNSIGNLIITHVETEIQLQNYHLSTSTPPVDPKVPYSQEPPPIPGTEIQIHPIDIGY